MNISKDGRVIIIDDKPKEVEPLFNIFSKLGIPYLFYTGEVEYLPEHPAELSPRFLFLDLNLTITTSSAQKNDKAILHGVLSRVLGLENVPYALIIWSKSDSRLRGILDELFSNELSKKQPLIKLNLDKSDYFILNTDSNWVLKYNIEKTIKKLTNKIREEFKKLDSIEFILNWENISYDSISEMTNGIYNLTLNDSDRNKSLKEIYYKIAEAFWGKQIQLGIYSKASATVLNNIFSDRNEINLFEKISPNSLKLLSKPDNIGEKKTATLNTQLLTSKSFLEKILPGSIYILENPDTLMIILRNVIDRNSLLNNYCDEKKIQISEIKDNHDRIKKEYIADFYKYVDEEKVPELAKRVKYIEIEISPLCDYSQNKQINHKTLSGLILPTDYFEYIKKYSDFLYKTPKIEMDSEIYFVILDLRFIHSPSKNTLKSKATIRLRQTILNDIQLKLGQYLSRIGVIFIENKQ